MLLGDFALTLSSFSTLEKTFASFRTKAFKTLSHRKKFDAVNSALLDCILAEEDPCFLLPALLEFIGRVNSEQLLQEPYRMRNFEFWLNHFSQLSPEKNQKVRCKIVGKTISRDEYQLFFPIGMNKTLAGSHFVAAHLSPDVDTTIASFWGWVDAFGAQVGSGIHHWALPGYVTDSHIALLFQKLFGNNVLDIIARDTQTLSLTALDLLSNKNVLKIPTSDPVRHIHAGRHIIAVDEQGHFKGDWRASDSVAAGQVVEAFYSLVRWFEHTIYYQLISAFSKESVNKKEVQKSLDALFATKLHETDPACEYTEAQKIQTDTFLKAILALPKGLKATYKELFSALDKAANIQLLSHQFVPDAMFAKNGTLKENRPHIFKHLEELFRAIANSSTNCRYFLDKLDVLLAIKTQVLGIPSQFITLKSDVDEIRTKMNNLEYLTVAIPEEDGNWFPLGVVYANDIKRNPLGTVSLRDFSNENETKMASYLEVVSIIDHHKSDIKTSRASTINVGDAQSANTIVAELVIKLNERYSLLGMSPKDVGRQKRAVQKSASSLFDCKKLKRLLQLTENAERMGSSYIHPLREYSEYLFFLHAILDDTDLLTKVSNRDLEVIQALLNRMKSISCQQDCEIICFDDITRDEHFAQNATRRVLQNDDMYSIYQKIYAHKEKEVEANLAACIKGKPSNIFADTKEQNGCARIGQTKLFSTNFATYTKHADSLQKLWLDTTQKILKNTPQIDLHMQMITTIASADEVYRGKTGKWKHQDEMWIWVPPVQGAVEHLVNFLNAFSSTLLVQENDFEVHFLGANYWDLELVFSQNFPKAARFVSKAKDLPIAVLRFKAGLLNSRKAYITPYLPRSIS